MVSPAGIFRRTTENKGKGKLNRAEKVDKIEGRESTHREKASILPGQLAEEEEMSKTAPMDKRPVIWALGDFLLHGRRGEGCGRRGKYGFGEIPRGKGGAPYLYGGISAWGY